MISQEARKAVPLKWTFRFRFAKPTEKIVQEIDLNSTFSKNVSGCWSAWNDRMLISPHFSRGFYKHEPKLTHSFGRSSQLKVKKLQKSWSFGDRKSGEMWTFWSFWIFLKVYELLYLASIFGNISDSFPNFFLLFCSARSTGYFQWSIARFFLLWVAAVSLETLNTKVKKLLSNHLWGNLIVLDPFFEKWWPKTTRTDFLQSLRTF